MDKLKMQTPDLTERNFAALVELFPNAVTETVDENGVVVRAIDKDVLAQEINVPVVEGREERYQFTWPDKRKSILLANASIVATLRPCREESVNFDTTENLYIEGDNLDVLKLLCETYFNHVKMIYIDPPYNTGNDFIYADDFAEDVAEFLVRDGQYGEDGNRMVKNLDSNGRFHTDWLNMVYPRLRVAQDLLTAGGGVIFISVDENEIENLKKICNEIFGESNFRSCISWQKRYTRSNNTVEFTTMVEYILVYSKSPAFNVNLLMRSEEADSRYTNPDNDLRGAWKGASFLNPASPSQRPNLCYPITNPNTGTVTNPTTHAWRRSKEVFEQLAADNRLYWGLDGTSNVPSVKMFLSEARGLTPINFWSHEYAGNTDNGTAELGGLLGGKYFEFPKPSLLIKRVLEHGTDEDSIVLDFFSGSATTAHAVMQLNAEDGGNRKFIMVQLPEVTDENSEAFKAGYANICEIGKERIRRAGQKIQAEWERKHQHTQISYEANDKGGGGIYAEQLRLAA
jgi:adenine-specific DNA-methyltransferase